MLPVVSSLLQAFNVSPVRTVSADPASCWSSFRRNERARCPLAPTRGTLVLREDFAQRRNAASILFHRANRNTHPFRQVVPFHRANDDFALEQRAKDRKAVAHIQQNEICRARNEPQIHRSKFLFEKR